MSDIISRRRLRGRPAIIAAALGLVVVGGGAGALAVEGTRPSVMMAPATPVAIRSISDDSIVTIRGRVAEVYGNKFVMADASGRALIDTGRDGEDGTLVAVGQPVTVQGRFDHGFVRAAFLVGADGEVVAVGPLGKPPHDRRGPHHGPDDRDGPGRDGPGRDGPGGEGPAAASAPPPVAATIAPKA